MIYRERLKKPNTSELSSEGDESGVTLGLHAPSRGVSAREEELAQVSFL